MTYNVREIGKWFVDNNSEAASQTLNGHLKLQKLLYYAQAMNFAVNDEELFQDEIQAWENGPVVNDMFIEYRHNDFVTRAKQFEGMELDQTTERILEIINSIYGVHSGSQLVDLTHSEEPWKELEDQANNRLNPTIQKEKIKEYYKPLADLYDLFEGYDFSNEAVEKINGNVFVFDKTETVLNEKNYRDLWNLGEEVADEKFFVYKDENDELVMY